MISVKGKWALITGASRGIGFLAADFMAQHGCNLILHSRRIEHSQKVLDAVKAHGVEAWCVQADLANHAKVVAAESPDLEIKKSMDAPTFKLGTDCTAAKCFFLACT